MTFSITLPVRFADCDTAGIGYFPRLLALVDAAIEDWTAATIGVDRRTMHGELHRGMPTANLDTQFVAPCRLGEMLTLTVRVTKLGVTSISLDVTAEVEGRTRFSAQLVQVLIDTDSGAAVPWPDAWRQQLSIVLADDV